MRPTTRAPIETLPLPGTAASADLVDVLERAEEPERLDESLHFSRAWHRYRYCYRRPETLKILDAGCGTGRSAIAASRLNRGVSVLGVDRSAEAVDRARQRSQGIESAGAVEFRVHDFNELLPEREGRFDFIVCRRVLSQVDNPFRLLANLVPALEPAGLLLVTIASHSERQIARAFRRAVDALAPADARRDEQLALGLELFGALRPDHPIRTHVARRQHSGSSHEEVEPILAGYLADRHDWDLDAAAALLARAGLKLLYAATPWRWRLDRVFDADSLTGRLQDRVDRLAPDRLSLLIDTLDPALLDDEYHLYACHDGYAPPVPAWPTTRFEDPEAFDRLVPEFTGLMDPSRIHPSGLQGRVSYRTVLGVMGELDRSSTLLLAAVNGQISCGEIERTLASQMRASDHPIARQERWIDLADSGLILLNPREKQERGFP